MPTQGDMYTHRRLPRAVLVFKTECLCGCGLWYFNVYEHEGDVYTDSFHSESSNLRPVVDERALSR